MTTMEILGQDWSDDSLWVALRDDDGFEDEFEVHEFDLDVMQRSVNRGYSARLFGRWLDETQVRTLANAILAPQRFWPPVICREGGCGAEASVRIEGEPYCHGHAQGWTAREEGQ
jgi:hypothetical protein